MRRINVLMFLFHAAIISAQNTSYWTGAGGTTPANENFSVPGNWLNNANPSSGDYLVFSYTNLTGSSTVTPNNNIVPSYNLAAPGSNPYAISLDSGSLGTGFTIAGSAFVIPVGGTAINVAGGGTTISKINNALTLNGTLSINGNSGLNQLNGLITGTGGITLTGSIVLGQTANTYMGNTKITAGATLYSGAGSALSPNSDVEIDGGGTLSLKPGSAAFSGTIKSILTGSTGSIVLGSGTLTIANGNSVTFSGGISATSGGLTLSGGTLTLTGANTNFSSLANPATVTVSSGATLIAGAPNALGSVASGSYTNLKVDGTLNLMGMGGDALVANQLSGSGMVFISTSTLTISAGTVTSAAFTGTITGTGGLTLNGGALTLTGSNTYTGTTTIGGGGTLIIGNSAAISGTTNITFPNGSGTIQANAGFSFSGAGGVNMTTAQADGIATFSLNTHTVTIAANISATASGTGFDALGPGTLVLSGMNTITSATVNFTDGVILQCGSNQLLDVAGGSTYPAVNLLRASHLNLTTFSNTIGPLNGTGDALINLGSGTLTIQGGGINNAYYGLITGAGNLVVTGGFATLMNSANVYTGTTNVSKGGMLNIVNPGTTSGLTLGGTGSGSVFLGSNSTLPAVTIPTAQTAVVFPNTYSVTLNNITGGASGSILNISGPGTTILNGPTASVASILIEGGTVKAKNAGLGTIPISIQALGPTLQAAENLVITQSISVAGKLNDNLAIPFTFDANTFTNSFSGQFVGGGVPSRFILTDSAGHGKLTVTNLSNSWVGTTTILNGTLNAVQGAIPETYPPSNPLQLVFGGVFQPMGATPIFQLGGAFTAFKPAIVMMSSGTIDLNTHNMSLSGVLAGGSSNTLTVTDSVTAVAPFKTLTLSGTNIFKGTIVVNHATVTAGSTSAFGSATINLGADGALTLGTFNNTIGSLTGTSAGVTPGIDLGTGTLTISNGNGNTYSGVITGSGGLTLTTGTLTLSGANVYTGATTINGGTLKAGSGTSLPSASAFTIANGATLDLNTFASSIGSLAGPAGGKVLLGTVALTLNSGGGHSFGGNITGTGAAALTLTAAGGTQILSGTNSYPGPTTINIGTTLQAGSTGALSPTSAFTIAGTLNLNGFSNTVASITGAGTIQLGSGILTISNGAGNTFSGPITNAGGGGITLSSGTLTLSHANTYTGPTTVNGGTLIASNGNTSPFGVGSAITVAGPGTINFGTVLAAGISVGSLNNSGTTIADLSSVTAAGITMGSYKQGAGTTLLNLKLPVTPGASFEAFNVSGSINLGTTGSLTVTNLMSTGVVNPVILMNGNLGDLKGSYPLANVTIPANFSLAYDKGDALVFLQGGDPATQCTGTWNFAGSSTWDTTADWTSTTMCVPGINAPAQIHDLAYLPDVPGGTNITITLSNAAGTSGQNISLYDLNISGVTTSYTVAPFVSSSQVSSTITLDGSVSPKPRITVSAGSHTIEAPILLNKDSRIQLDGILRMGLFSSIKDGSTASTLYISEGANASGTFISEGQISPSNVNIQGCTVDNLSLITPSVSLTVGGLAGNVGPLTLNNQSLILAPTITINGGAGSTIINNIGPGQPFLGFGEIFTDTGALTVTATTVANTLGGRIAAGDSQLLIIATSQFTNDAASIIGTFASNINFVSGSITTSGQMEANNYTQGAASTLQINVQNQTNGGHLEILGTADLGGTLVVNALSGFPTAPLNNAIELVVDTNGFATSFASYSLQNFPSSVIPEIVTTNTQILLNTIAVIPSHHAASIGPKVVVSAITAHNNLISRKGFQLNRRMPATNQGTVAAADLFDEEELYAENEEIAQRAQTRQKAPQLARKAGKKPMTTKPWNVYLGPIADFGHVKTVNTQIGFGHSSVGGFAGFDKVLTKSTQGSVAAGMGAIVEYRRVWGTILQDGGSLSVDRIHGSLYGTILPTALPQLYFEWILGTVYTWDRLVRNTGFQNSVHPKASTNEAVFDAFGGVEFTFDKRLISRMGNFSLTPLFHVQYAYDHINGYKETGGGIYDLSVPSIVVQSLGTSLGARFDYFFCYPQFNLLLEIDGEWQREYLTNNKTVGITPFNLTSTATDSILYGVPGNGLLAAVDAFATFRNGVQLEGNCTFQWNSQAYSATFFVELGREF